jgi:hypothetical protein
MRAHAFVFVVTLLLSPSGLAQLRSSQCDLINGGLQDCPSNISQGKLDSGLHIVSQYRNPAGSSEPEAPGSTDNYAKANSSLIASQPKPNPGFHWRRALQESFTFLTIEQGYVVHSDFYWVTVENGVPFNHYWRDYTHSLSTWLHSPWNDGDPNWYGYVGHPVQGALTGFIQIQNDPQGERLEFSKTKAYWWSRLKSGLWNAAYSTQWNLGPLSEVTVEKYGTKVRGPWNYNGSYPCYRHCVTGVGQIDIVMTPLGGTGWLIGEDFLDRFIVRRVEDVTPNRFLIDTVRCALNPIRGGANILHGEPPWYRASRDRQEGGFPGDGNPAFSTAETRAPQVPRRGDLFLGYSHMSGNPLSGEGASGNGWEVSAEEKVLRHFGAVAEFTRQTGDTAQRDFLFGLRGGTSIKRIRPFAQAVFGFVQIRESGLKPSGLVTSFAEGLGVGVDSPVTRLLSLRVEADSLMTSFNHQVRQDLRLSAGPVLSF